MAFSVARLAVSAATFPIDKPYDYLIPDEIRDRAVPGMRVIVPFGRGNKRYEGVILSLAADDERADGGSNRTLKRIEALLDDEPVLSDESIRLAIWMSDRFFCTVYEAIRAMLPAGMWFKDGVRRLGDKTANTAVLLIERSDASALADKKQKTAPRQAGVLRMLAAAGRMPVRELCHFTGASSSVITALAGQGVISIEEREAYRRPGVDVHGPPVPIELNQEQSVVAEQISRLLISGKPEAALLYGVTGSGKTVIYIKLIETVLSLGKTAIVLVPEIALTPQTVSIFTAYFGDSVAVLHSALAPGERYDEWKRIRSGTVRVVIGTRSAVFAPLRDIGLIVIDEEQEHTYKSESSPRYHARDVAKYRVTFARSLLLLSSATPSVESMYCAATGKYRLFRIEKRFNESALPPVAITDMRADLKNGNAGSISSVLRRELSLNISRGEQSILFINRRGANPLVACGECGYTFRCGSCSVSLTYHSSKKRMLCHYCGFSEPVPAVCPDCGGKLKFTGAGTQKVEEELLELFPGVSIIRMDADTVTRANPHARLLAGFRDGDAQILLGTQMVTKGLDFENVTLVGVLSADMSLYTGDFRANERTFSIITQVAGRSGRGEKPGRAILQTFTPGHDVIRLASRQDYDGFYKDEIAFRQALGAPPVRDLIALTAAGPDEAAVINACARLHGALSHYFGGTGEVKILGPAPAPVVKVRNTYRYRLMLNCSNTKRVRETIAHTIREFSRDKQGRGVSVFADAQPYD